jgi:fructokinase
MSYDPNLRAALWPSLDAARQGMIAGLDYAHVLKITDEELVFMTGGSDIAPLWRPGMQIICVTRGEHGATVHTRSESVTLPAFKVDSIDTTGAGDGFVAGILTQLLETRTDAPGQLERIVRFACAVGALATTKKGGIPGLPTRAQVDAFLAQQ